MSSSVAKESYWLTSSEQLDVWLRGLPENQPLVMDTEFERVSTFYPRPGLLQLAVGEDARLVEPSAAADSDILRAILTDSARIKLLYAMGEDLELVYRWLGIHMAGALDLQLALAFCGYGHSVGYARAVEALLGEVVSKEQTRSDWLRRPLSLEQETYALADVHHLEQLWARLQPELTARGLESALQEESDRLCQAPSDEPDPRYYLRMQGAWRLTGRQQQVLAHLAFWRERQCRLLDVPRGRLVTDAVLISVAEKMPRTLAALSAIPDMLPKSVRHWGADLLGLIEQGGAKDPLPTSDRILHPLTREEQNRYRSWRDRLSVVATATGVPMELLAPRRLLETSIRQFEGTEPFVWLQTGWRGQLTSGFLDSSADFSV